MPSPRTRSRIAATRAVPGAAPSCSATLPAAGMAEAPLEVLVGVVEDEERPAAQRREPAVDRRRAAPPSPRRSRPRWRHRRRRSPGRRPPSAAAIARAAATALSGSSQRWPSCRACSSPPGRGRASLVVVGLERAAGADRQQRDARGVLQRDHGRVGRQRGDRLGEPGRQVRADPDDEVRLLQQAAPRTAAAHSRAARRPAAGSAPGAPTPGHHPRGDRLHRRDVGRHPRRAPPPRPAAATSARTSASARRRHAPAPPRGALWPARGATRMPAPAAALL